jgi:hypothetical protein
VRWPGRSGAPDRPPDVRRRSRTYEGAQRRAGDRPSRNQMTIGARGPRRLAPVARPGRPRPPQASPATPERRRSRLARLALPIPRPYGAPVTFLRCDPGRLGRPAACGGGRRSPALSQGLLADRPRARDEIKFCRSLARRTNAQVAWRVRTFFTSSRRSVPALDLAGGDRSRRTG